jgi:TolB protein
MTGPHSPSITGPQSYTTGPQQAVASDSVAVASAMPARKKARWIVYAALLAGFAIAAFVLLYFFVGEKQSKSRPVTAFQTPKITKLTSTGKSIGAVISPDGKYVAHFVEEDGLPSLWVRQVATSSNERKIPPADIIYRGLAFSRDSNYIYYTTLPKGGAIATLYQMPVFGGEPKKVLEDVDSSITFSPDGKRFAFIRGYPREKEMALMVINTDGTGEQKLAVRKTDDPFTEAEWSPDGKVIMCPVRSLVGGFHMQLVAVQVADGAMTQIGSQRWGILAGLAWLPDNNGLIVSASEQRGGINQIQLYQVSYPGGEARRITNDLNNYAGVSLTADSSMLVTAQTDAIMNVWSVPAGDSARARQITSGSSKSPFLTTTPDGKIVYVSDAAGHLDIWIMDADGKNQKQLTNDETVDLWPTVSPDGRYIVFGSNRATGTSAHNIWRIDLDGAHAKQLTSGQGEYWPVVSADNKWVIYTPIGEQEKFTLWKVPIDGGEPVRITEKMALQAVPSPDGKLLAAWHFSNMQSPVPKLAIMQMETGQVVKEFDLSPPRQIGEFSSVQWTPDGKGVTYIDAKGGTANLWMKPIDGGPPRQLTSFNSDQIFTYKWMPDGKNLVCIRGFSQTDVILIRDEERLEARK